MADILGLINTVVAPFTQNAQLAYILVLIILGTDAFVTFNVSHDPLNQPQLPNLEQGQYFVLWGQDIYGNPLCSISDGTWLPYSLVFPPRRANLQEINQYCAGFFNDQPCTATLSCGYENNLGISGSIVSGGFWAIGNAFNIDLFKNMQIFSWELFLLMLSIPILVWIATQNLVSK